MTPLPNLGTFLVFLSLMWLGYFLYLWLFWLDVPGESVGTKRYQLIFKIKVTPRLCHYHGIKYIKPGKFVLLVSQERCVLCKKGRY